MKTLKKFFYLLTRQQMLQAPESTWSLLAYVCVDDPILSDHGKRDIEEMAKGKKSSNTHIATQIDTQGDFGSLRYEISEPDFEGKAHRLVIERLEETYTGDPKILKDFLVWGLKRSTPKHRLLVLSGHGQGFRAPERDVFWEEKRTGLLVPEVKSVMDESNCSVDVFGFDACYMNLLEIAHQFRDVATYFISSQDSSPAPGWNYENLVNELGREPEPKELADKIVDIYADSYRDQKNRTISVIETAKTSEVMKALNQLGAKLRDELENDPTAKSTITKARTQTQRFTQSNAEAIDGGDFAIKIQKHFKNMSNETEALQQSVEGAVTKNEVGENRINSTGLSIWFPDRGFIYRNGRPEYVSLAGDCPEWLDFLDTYHSL